jgi:hypothetical protein
VVDCGDDLVMRFAFAGRAKIDEVRRFCEMTLAQFDNGILE